MKHMKFTREKCYLTIIVLLSAILNFLNIGIEGTSNSYYAAAVKSMTLSLKNFFFVAMDPAGLVTVDKPPFGFWMQALSAKLFGFHGWSILLPQAIAGVLSVLILYHIVKKSFGVTAGLLSSLFLAITPVFVAVSRNNTIDNQLVFVLLLACLAFLHAMEKGRFLPLALTMILIGLGFNIKQLQAYMILPAIYITYMFVSTIPLKKRLVFLSASTVILLAVSFSWALIVDLIPANARPYVGSSANNSELELILEHNGTERLGLSNTSDTKNSPPNKDGQSDSKKKNEKGDFSKKMDGSSQLAGSFGAQIPAGFNRLFSKNILSDQIVWFLPLALFGFIGTALLLRLCFKLDTPKKQVLVLFFFWALPEFVYFSFTTGLFHPHYLTMLAPPIAALSGIGVTSMWTLYKSGGSKAFLLPISLLCTGGMHLLMLIYFYDSSVVINVLAILVIVLCFFLSFFMIINLVKKNCFTRFCYPALCLCVVGILICPLAGSIAAPIYGVNSQNPSAGLELITSASNKGNRNMAPKGRFDQASSLTDVIEYISKQTDNTPIELIVSSANTAESITLSSNLQIGSLSGFMGYEKVMSLAQFKELVKDQKIRYVLVSDNDRRNSSNTEIMNWVKEEGKVVSGIDNLYDLSYVSI